MNVLNDQPEPKPVSSARALVGPSTTIEDAAKNCIISTFAAKLQRIQTNVEAKQQWALHLMLDNFQAIRMREIIVSAVVDHRNLKQLGMCDDEDCFEWRVIAINTDLLDADFA